MAMSPTPYLLVDVDGVLAPFVFESAPLGFALHTVRAANGRDYDVWLNPAHGAWLRRLGEQFELVWATGWVHEAPRLLSPLLGLPPMPVIEFAQPPVIGAPLWKLQDVDAYVADRPVAWVDDDLDVAVESWASQRESPTLLIKTDCTVGLTGKHVSELVEFATQVGDGD
jgi:hypothetical protein